MTPYEEIAALFDDKGNDAYFGEEVTQLQHALQSAQLARTAGADRETIVAALLHDIGHLLEGETHAEIGVIDHDRVAEPWLRSRGFSERLIRLVRGHVDAKRYLVATNPSYFAKLSGASKQTLALQGGPMSREEADAFAQDPHFKDILQLRSWDELAKDPHASAGQLSNYRTEIVSLLR